MPDLRSVVALSGPIAAGKTSTAESLRTKFDWLVFRTRDILAASLPPEQRGQREALAKRSAALASDSEGDWLGTEVARTLQTQAIPDNAQLAIDAVRRTSELNSLRRHFGPVVLHVHLIATYDELARRYELRHETPLAVPYHELSKRPGEEEVGTLQEIADMVIDTTSTTPHDVATLIHQSL
jgi:adenylosuccinate synthase